jgi:hypothetical protein
MPNPFPNAWQALTSPRRIRNEDEDEDFTPHPSREFVFDTVVYETLNLPARATVLKTPLTSPHRPIVFDTMVDETYEQLAQASAYATGNLRRQRTIRDDDNASQSQQQSSSSKPYVIHSQQSSPTTSWAKNVGDFLVVPRSPEAKEDNDAFCWAE